MVSVLAFVFGSILGSFANVCIYRLPREHSLCRPQSRCSFCGQPILWYDNIPLLSFFVLGGKCRYCQTFFSVRYLLVETLMAGLSALCYHHVVASAHDYPSGFWEVDRVVVFGAQNPHLIGAYFVGCAFLAVLVIATFIDLDFQIIPDSVTLGGLAIAILVSLVNPHFHTARDPLLDGLFWDRCQDPIAALIPLWAKHLRALSASLLGAAVGAAVVWLVGEFGKLIFRKDAMGFGDVKYCAMIGALLGWQIAVATLVLASILGALAGIVILLRTRQSRMPFGPYLSIAAALLFFHREAFFRLPALWMGFVYRTASRFDNLLSLRVLSVLLFLLFLGCCVILALLIMRNRVPGRIAQPPLGGEKQTEQEVASDGPNDETAG